MRSAPRSSSDHAVEPDRHDRVRRGLDERRRAGTRRSSPSSRSVMSRTCPTNIAGPSPVRRESVISAGNRCRRTRSAVSSTGRPMIARLARLDRPPPTRGHAPRGARAARPAARARARSRPRTPPEHPLRRGVELADAPIRVEDDHRVDGRGDDRQLTPAGAVQLRARAAPRASRASRPARRRAARDPRRSSNKHFALPDVRR